MPKTVDEMIEDILSREGGYTNNPADRGGPTNFGVTQATLAEWRGVEVTPEDVEQMTIDEARSIYLTNYLIKPRLYNINNAELLAHVFDCAINHGPSRVIKWLQEIVGTEPTGTLDWNTTLAINNYSDPDKLYSKLLARRIVFYGEIVRNKPSQSVFIVGWLKRAVSFLK